MLGDFQQLNTQVLGVSVDMAPTQKVFAEQCGADFPLVSGFPNHEGAKALGVYNEERGTARRVTFVVDKEGVIRGILQDLEQTTDHPVQALEVIKSIEGKT